MIYKTKEGDVDLSRLVRLYAAGIVEMQSERAEMSLEWIEMYAERIHVVEYVLVFDSTLPSEDVKNRVVLRFETKEALLAEMAEVAKLFA